MGTHPIFESDFDCLTDMEEDELLSPEEILKIENELELKLANMTLEDLEESSDEEDIDFSNNIEEKPSELNQKFDLLLEKIKEYSFVNKVESHPDSPDNPIDQAGSVEEEKEQLESSYSGTTDQDDQETDVISNIKLSNTIEFLETEAKIQQEAFENEKEQRMLKASIVIQKYFRGFLIRRSPIGRQIRTNRISRSHVKYAKMAEKHEFDERVRLQKEADDKRAEEDRKLKTRLQEEKLRMEEQEAKEEQKILQARKERIFKQKILEFQKKRLIINRRNASIKIQKWWRLIIKEKLRLQILKLNLEEFCRNRAARIIQSSYRNFLLRRVAKEAQGRLEIESAIVIQTYWRSFIVRQLFKKLKNATIVIQEVDSSAE